MSEENLDLDAILSGDEPDHDTDTESEAEAGAVVEAEASESSQESESEAESSKEEAKQKEGESDSEEPKDWSYHAYKDEKAKRQAAEKRLRELESQSTKEDGKKRPNVFDDQDAFADSIRDEMKAELQLHKLKIAQDMMRETHDDYDAEEAFFISTIAKDNPVLAEEAKKSSNPAKFVYEMSKKYKQYQEMKDLEAYKEKLKSEIRDEMKSEQESKSKKTTLTKAAAVKGETFKEDSLSELLDGR